MMVTSVGKDGIRRQLIYQNSILMIDKEDELLFTIDNEYLKYNIKFTFSNEGEKYSTTIWESTEHRYVHYQLNGWFHPIWIEASVPAPIKIPSSNELVWMKFRSIAEEGQPYRQFNISIWKEVNDAK